jgi:aspartate aminotransferase/aminotransferase
MKVGKGYIHKLPVNDITTLGVLAQQLQLEAESSGNALPAAARLHIGEPSFRTPEHICLAAIEAIQNGQITYGPPAGWHWLRELLAEKIVRVDGYRVEPANTAIALGGTGAIMAALCAIVEPGDEVLIPDPCWPQYRLQAACFGAPVIPYPLDPQNEWLPDIAQLERLVTSRTRLLIINSPGNPTGAVFPSQLMADLIDFAYRHDLYILSDECYDELVFDGEHVSPAVLMDRNDFESGRVICVYTFSKTYAMTGWRIGYLAAGTGLVQTISTVLDASNTNISTIVQRAAAAALTGPQDCVTEMRVAYQKRRDLAVRLLKDYGRYVYTPHGAFYALINVANGNGEKSSGRQFMLDLLRERNVTVAAGSIFGSVAQNFVRISLATSEEEIKHGVREICMLADK